MVGEALIRPSSKSSDSLAIHWVVREGCIKVVEVLEEDKDNDASIGNILKVKVSRTLNAIQSSFAGSSNSLEVAHFRRKHMGVLTSY